MAGDRCASERLAGASRLAQQLSGTTHLSSSADRRTTAQRSRSVSVLARDASRSTGPELFAISRSGYERGIGAGAPHERSSAALQSVPSIPGDVPREDA